MQAIAKPFLKSDKARLSNECLKVFDDWLYHYLFGILPGQSEIPEYRDLLKPRRRVEYSGRRQSASGGLNAKLPGEKSLSTVGMFIPRSDGIRNCLATPAVPSKS